MLEHLKVGTWACVDDQCPIRPVVHPEDDAVTFIFGKRDEIELFLSTAALRNLVRLGTKTLNDLEADGRQSSVGELPREPR